jgi:hypothetical protein
MSYSYSPSTKGFYNADVNLDNVPNDSIDITYEQYQTLLNGINQGQTIDINADGIPILVGTAYSMPGDK